MQKKMIVLTIMAAFAAPVAMADTANVNVYGTIDGGLRSETGAVIDNLGSNRTAVTFGSGRYHLNRWGIKGSEDLGGGMKATFGLEGGFNTGTGAVEPATGLFARNATVGIISDLGKVDLGRQFALSYKTIFAYDPFGYRYLTIALAGSSASSVFYDNDLSYTGKFGDVVVMAEHAMGTTGDTRGSVSAVGLSYANGPINVGAAKTVTKEAIGGTAPQIIHVTAGAGYKIGNAKVSVGYATNDSDAVVGGISSAEIANTNTNVFTKNTWIGASYNVSDKIGVTVAYYRRANKPSNALNTLSPAFELASARTMIGGTYALSKRTTFYAEMDRTTTETGLNQAGATTAQETVSHLSSGASLGLATSF